jgi:hypothetical protein
MWHCVIHNKRVTFHRNLKPPSSSQPSISEYLQSTVRKKSHYPAKMSDDLFTASWSSTQLSKWSCLQDSAKLVFQIIQFSQKYSFCKTGSSALHQIPPTWRISSLYLHPPKWQDGPVILPGMRRFHFHHMLWLTSLWLRYSNQSPYRVMALTPSEMQIYHSHEWDGKVVAFGSIVTVSQSIQRCRSSGA